MSTIATPARTSGASGRRSALDRWIPWLGSALLLVAAWRSASTRRFWTDECLTAWVVELDSPAAVWSASQDMINASPPLYFLSAWAWARPFGISELSLRMFTALALALGFVLAHRALRRAFPAEAAAVGACTALLGCSALVEHGLEARFYGLYLLEIAAGVLWLVRVAARGRLGALDLAAQAAIHAALVATHYFGGVYSLALLAASSLALRRDPRAALRAVAAGVLGWAAFLPWLATFRRHAEFGGDTFWVPRPYLHDLLGVWDLLEFPGFVALVLAATALAATALAGDRRAEPVGDTRALAGDLHAELEAPEPVRRARAAWLALGLTFALVPPVTWLVSRSGTLLFLERYFFPSTLVFALGLAQAFAWLAQRANGTRAARAVVHAGAALLIAAAALVPVLHAGRARGRDWMPPRPEDLAHGPLVLESTRSLPFVHYAARPEDCVFVQDEPLTLDPATAKRSRNSHQIVAALARHTPRVRTITSAELLATRPSFVVLDVPEHPWFETRVQRDERFSCRALGGEPVRWLVTRVADGR